MQEKKRILIVRLFDMIHTTLLGTQISNLRWTYSELDKFVRN